MERKKSYVGRPSYRFLPSSPSNEHLSEPDELDIWNWDLDHRKSTDGQKMAMKKRSPGKQRVEDKGGGSLPLNVPNCSRILREENGRRRKVMEDEKDEESGDRIPPHEVVARRAKSRRVASFSLHEGLGRTLKGRDLCKVRNAIWEKMGFQD